MKELVIFRREFDQYRQAETFLAVFPQDEANIGRFAALPFAFNNGRPVFEPYCEIAQQYYYKNTRIVHKNTELAEKLLKTIEDFYGEQFEVRERMSL